MAYRMLTIEDYIAYFQELVDSATFLDYMAYGYEELIHEKKSKVDGTIFVLEPYANPISGDQNDNIIGTRKGMFVIARHAKGTMDIRTIHDACERLAYKVIGRMRRDRREQKLSLNIGNWSGHATGMLTDTGYTGYAIEFTYEAPINQFLVEEPGDWT